MNVFCCLREDRHLLLGIPPTLSWSITATPSESGSVLTLHIEGADDIQLLGGNPVNLSEQTIEIKDFSKAYPDIIGSAQYLDISQLSGDVCYFEVGRLPNNSECIDNPTAITEPQTQNTDPKAYYKWSRILAYLEDRLGAVAVSAWLDDAVVMEFTEDSLKIQIGSEFRCQVVKRRCLNYIQYALMELFHSKATVDVFSCEN